MGPYEVAVAMAAESAMDALWHVQEGVSRPCPRCGADATKHSADELARRMGSCLVCMESMRELTRTAHGVHNTALGIRAQHKDDPDREMLKLHLAVMAVCLALSSVQGLLHRGGPTALLVLTVAGQQWQATYPGGPGAARDFIATVVGTCREQFSDNPLVQRFELAAGAMGPELEA